MNFFFDYIYYRVNQFFFKKDGRKGDRSINAVTWIQFGIFLNVYIIILEILDFHTKKGFSPLVKWGIIGVGLGVFYYNDWRYSGKYNKYRFHWKDESKETRFYKGILVIISLIVPWVTACIMGIYWRSIFR